MIRSGHPMALLLLYLNSMEAAVPKERVSNQDTTTRADRETRSPARHTSGFSKEQRFHLANLAALERQSLLDPEDEGSEIIETEEVGGFANDPDKEVTQFGLQNYGMDEKESRSYSPHSGCEIKHETVTVVKQVPSFTKHCQRVEDTKCKTIFKNAFTTQIETQCMATFDTSCDNTLETAYKQQCKTIVDVECRIVNLESKDGHHESKKICEDVPTEKCVPVPVKVEGQKCVNVPTQMCENVPVTVAQEVPQQQCYKKPRKVCQTLVSTKPKVVTAQIPREVCGHEATSRSEAKKSSFPPISTGASFPSLSPGYRPSVLPTKMMDRSKEPFQSGMNPTNGEDYDYPESHKEDDVDDFNYPREPSVPRPSQDGFDNNLLQFLHHNN